MLERFGGEDLPGDRATAGERRMVRAERDDAIDETVPAQHSRLRDAAHRAGLAVDVGAPAFADAAAGADLAARHGNQVADLAGDGGLGFGGSSSSELHAGSHGRPRGGWPSFQTFLGAFLGAFLGGVERFSCYVPRGTLAPQVPVAVGDRVKHPANALCPVCGDQGELESTGGGREWRAYCLSCLAPVGFGLSAEEALDNWIGDASRGGRSPAEVAWLKLLQHPQAYAEHVDRVRRRWEAENVVWFHGYRNGKAIWRRERPPQEPTDEAPARFARRGKEQP